MNINAPNTEAMRQELVRLFTGLASSHRSQSIVAKRKGVANEHRIKANTYDNVIRILKEMDLTNEQISSFNANR